MPVFVIIDSRRLVELQQHLLVAVEIDKWKLRFEDELRVDRLELVTDFGLLRCVDKLDGLDGPGLMALPGGAEADQGGCGALG